MSSRSNALQSFGENGDEGNKILCQFHGCKRVYTNVSALDSHVKDHVIPTDSLSGKVFHCSSVFCSCSFPNMQKLMEHMRRHHKPNIFFMCENCRTKLRSYRGLLTHLHTCSKVPRGKTKPSDQTTLQPFGAMNPNMIPLPANMETPQIEVMSRPQKRIPSKLESS